MATGLESYLRDKIDNIERMHSYELATDSLRCWIDEYNLQEPYEQFRPKIKQTELEKVYTLLFKGEISFSKATQILNGDEDDKKGES